MSGQGYRMHGPGRAEVSSLLGSHTAMETFYLLMELVSQEPTTLNCLRIVTGACLSQGITCTVKGKALSPSFERFISLHYVPFCENAVRAMFTCGFIPWRLRKLSGGDAVPEVLPLGTFTWSISSPQSRERRDGGSEAKRPRLGGGESAMYYRQQRALGRQKGVKDDDSTKSLRYRIHFVEAIGVGEDDVEIYEVMQPTNNVTYSSMLYSTVPSPLSHVIVDYRILRQAQIRQAHADAWNSQAKLVCSYAAPKNLYGVNEGNPIVNDQWMAPQNRLGLLTDTNLPTEIGLNAHTRDALAEATIGSKASEHRPIIYTLPKNTSLEATPPLHPVQDVQVLQQKLAKDVTSILGVPYELVSGGYSHQQGDNKSKDNGKVFATAMMEVCRHLQRVLGDVYTAAYGGSVEDVSFTLRPTPRISIESIADLAQLMQIGVVSPEDAKTISGMLMGVDLKRSSGSFHGIQVSGPKSTPFMTTDQTLQKASLAASATKRAAGK